MIPIEHRKPEPLEDVLFLVEYKPHYPTGAQWKKCFVVGYMVREKAKILKQPPIDIFDFDPPFTEYPANEWEGEIRVVSWAELPIMPE